VGIGNSSPAALLDIKANSPKLRIGQSTTACLDIWHDYSTADNYFDSNYPTGDIIFRTTASLVDRLHILSSGKVGIGISTPDYKLDIDNGSATGMQPVINMRAHTGCNDGPSLRLATGAGPAEIGVTRACLGGSMYGSQVHFWTTYHNGSSSSFTETLRIQHNGDLLSLSGSDSIGTLSDKRLKKNIEDFTYSLDIFKQLETKTFEWINPDVHASLGKEIGFLAQDVKIIDSRWVSDTFLSQDHADYDLIQDTHFTNIDENENEAIIGKTIATTLGKKDVMYISVIQQLLGKVETLEAKVTALENA